MNGKEKSIHLNDYPKANTKLIDKKLEQQMQTTRNIVSTALRERDRNQISLKWPLAKATIKSEIKLSEKLEEIVKVQLNIKKIIYEKSKGLSIELDTKLTPELESEGFTREITRKIQAMRKSVGLIKSEKIELEISSEFNQKIISQKDFIRERVGAKSLSFEKSSKKFEYSEEGKIKKNYYCIKFSKL